MINEIIYKYPSYNKIKKYLNLYQKNIYKKIINNIKLLHGQKSYGISHPNYDLINSKNIK